jgi:hypothetical protein
MAHTLASSMPELLCVICLVFALFTLLFAVFYAFIDGGCCGLDLNASYEEKFLEALWFSFQTFSTIGYVVRVAFVVVHCSY